MIPTDVNAIPSPLVPPQTGENLLSNPLIPPQAMPNQGIGGALNPNIYMQKGGCEEESKVGQKKNPTKGESEVWKNLDSVKGRDRKTSGIGSSKKYYEWNYTHNDIEVYNKKGYHLGSMDPMTGKIYKPAVHGRTIKID